MMYFGDNAVQDTQSLTIQKSDLGISPTATPQQILTALIENTRRYFQGIITVSGKPIIIIDNDPLEYDNSRDKNMGVFYIRNDIEDIYSIAIVRVTFKIPGDELTPIDINQL